MATLLLVICIASAIAMAHGALAGAKLSTVDTARNQFKRLVLKPIANDKSTKSALNEKATSVSYESITRITCSWLLLFLSKIVSLYSPLYFKRLITEVSVFDGSPKGANTSARIATQAAIIGLILGYSSTKIISGIVLLLSELLLFPVTLNAAMTLPIQTFNTAIFSASRRWSGGSSDVDGQAAESGYKARRVLDRGLRASNQCLYRSIFNLLPAAVELIAILILTFYKAGIKVSIASAIFAGLFIYTTGTIMRKRVVTLRQQLQCESAANVVAEDALSLAETVAAYSSLDAESKKYMHALKNVQVSSNDVRKSFSYLKLIQTLLLSVGSLVVTYFTWESSQTANASYDSTSSGSVGTGASQIVLSSALFSQLCAPLEHLGQHFRDFVGSLEDLRELEMLLSKNAATTTAAVSASTAARKATDAAAPLLELRGVSYSLGERQLLRNMSIIIPSTRGCSVAVVGPSGSGKSTLLRLLIGTLPMDTEAVSLQGQLFIEGNDVTFLDRHARFCVVNQESSLFRTLDIESNIKYGIESFIGPVRVDSDTALKRAMLDAGLSLSAMQATSETVPADRGEGGGSASQLLSGGEKQRVAIARALFHQQARGGILLMDEMTSSLDTSSEQAVIKAILYRVATDRASAILITHNLNVARDCDLIIVLQDGAIVESGDHAQLMRNRKGWYRENFSLQKH